MPIGIRDIAHYVPERVVGSAEIAAKHGFDERFIREKLGIHERRVARPDESTADLCVEAAEAVLARARIEPESVDLLVVVTQTPDYILPHTSALVHQRLGLRKSSAAFDISLGCSGFVYGLAAVVPLMEAHGMKTGLLIAADEYSKVMDPNDRATAPLFGDAAAATLIGERPRYVAGKYSFGSDGSRHEALIIHGSGIKAEPRGYLQMNGRAVFNFMINEVPADVTACLELNGLSTEDIDCWVFHQANKYMLESLAERIGIPANRLVIDNADIGNTTAASIPIALERRVLSDFSSPKRVLISGFGVGLSWAST
ncbi:MAG: 3-oxoacyl-ACP synthase III family protein, partial [Alphaproteobacteria bacterium]